MIDPLISFAALKQTDLATKLFEAFDGDADGDVSTADAGYLLGLLTAGTLRDRVDAACDAPGAPGASWTPCTARNSRSLIGESSESIREGTKTSPSYM